MHPPNIGCMLSLYYFDLDTQNYKLVKTAQTWLVLFLLLNSETLLGTVSICFGIHTANVVNLTQFNLPLRPNLL